MMVIRILICTSSVQGSVANLELKEINYICLLRGVGVFAGFEGMCDIDVSASSAGKLGLEVSANSARGLDVEVSANSTGRVDLEVSSNSAARPDVEGNNSDLLHSLGVSDSEVGETGLYGASCAICSSPSLKRR
jgi:hypothetical protein